MCIIKSDESKGSGITNDQEMKYAKEGHCLPQSSAWDKIYQQFRTCVLCDSAEKRQS